MKIVTGDNLIEADMHCHTIASTHAYSTIGEMASYASKIGLKAFAMTDHGPAMTDSPHLWHFTGLVSLPDSIDGVRIYKGIEANIIDFDGNLDIPVELQQKLEWVIASFHESVRAPGTFEQHTEAYLKLADNPYVNVIGHSAFENYRYDYVKVLPIFKQKGKLVEINNGQADLANCLRLASVCKQYEVPIVVDSDAHNCYSLCDVRNAIMMLNSIGFPEKLIINNDYKRIEQWISDRKTQLVI